MAAETHEVGGISYPVEVVNAFMKAKGKTDELDFPKYWLEQHLITFNEGWQAGQAAMDVPNCDDCDIYGKVAEAGPPESHYSQQDR